jgi:hypothetical protein
MRSKQFTVGVVPSVTSPGLRLFNWPIKRSSDTKTTTNTHTHTWTHEPTTHAPTHEPTTHCCELSTVQFQFPFPFNSHLSERFVCPVLKQRWQIIRCRFRPQPNLSTKECLRLSFGRPRGILNGGTSLIFGSYSADCFERIYPNRDLFRTHVPQPWIVWTHLPQSWFISNASIPTVNCLNVVTPIVNYFERI